MRLPKHGENHTQPSGNAKLEPRSLDPGTLLAPTTRLEGRRRKKSHLCAPKISSLFPSRHHFPRFPAGCGGVDEMGDYGRPGAGARSGASSLQAASPAAAHRLAQPRESNTGESTRAFCQRSRCASPGGFALRKFVISLLASETRRLRSFG